MRIESEEARTTEPHKSVNAWVTHTSSAYKDVQQTKNVCLRQAAIISSISCLVCDVRSAALFA
jgi:hypothetical protein